MHRKQQSMVPPIQYTEMAKFLIENLAKILIDNNGDINIKTVTNCFTPLFWTAVSNPQNIVDLLIKNRADVNAS